MEPFSVLHVIDGLDPYGGASVACLRLATPSATLPGVKVSIASRLPPQPWPLGTFDPFEMFYWDKEEDRAALSRAIQSADIVHLHGIWDPVLKMASEICVQAKKPYVITPHGMLATWPMGQKPLKKRLYLKTMGRRLLQDAHTIHFTAEQEREQSQSWIGDTRAWVAPLINDLTDDLEASKHLPPRRPTPGRPAQVLFLSRLNNKKGPDRAIDMLKDLDGVELLVAGRDDPAYRAVLKQRADSIGVSDRVRWIGEVDDHEKRRLYQTADVFVLPTHQENFGQVLVEAMASGLPVVTTRNVDIWRELQGGGAIIAEASPQAFAQAVRDLVDVPDECERLSRKGRDFIREWLDVKVGLDRYNDWYQSIVSTKQ